MHFGSEILPLQGTTQTFKHGKTLRKTKHTLIIRNVAPARHHPDLKKLSIPNLSNSIKIYQNISNNIKQF